MGTSEDPSAAHADRHRTVEPPRVVRSYRAVLRRRAQAENLMAGVLDGCFLGLMDRDALAHLDESFYDTREEVVDGRPTAYADTRHFESGLAPWEAEAVGAHFPAGGRVVVTAAGAGREVRALLRSGFDAVGFEPHRGLVEAGRRMLEAEGHPDRLHLCPRDRFPDQDAGVHAVVVGWGSYMLIPGSARRITFLRGARSDLAPGAPLLVSFFLRAPGRRYFDVVRVLGGRLRALRGAEPVEAGDALAPNYVHCFSRAEVEAELAAGGFRPVAFATKPYPHAVAVAT